MAEETRFGKGPTSRFGKRRTSKFRPRQGSILRQQSTTGRKSSIGLNPPAGSFGSGRMAGGASALLNALAGGRAAAAPEPSVVGEPVIGPPPVVPVSAPPGTASPQGQPMWPSTSDVPVYQGPTSLPQTYPQVFTPPPILPRFPTAPRRRGTSEF